MVFKIQGKTQMLTENDQTEAMILAKRGICKVIKMWYILLGYSALDAGFLEKKDTGHQHAKKKLNIWIYH